MPYADECFVIILSSFFNLSTADGDERMEVRGAKENHHPSEVKTGVVHCFTAAAFIRI